MSGMASEEQYVKFSWLPSQQEFSLLEKKGVKIGRKICLLSVLYLGTPCHHSSFTGAILTHWCVSVMVHFFSKKNVIPVWGSEIGF